MSQAAIIVLILALLVPLWLRLRKDFVGGVVYAVLLLVALTPLIRIQTPGALPELTLHRLIFLTLAIAWWRLPQRRPLRSVPLFGWIATWAILAFISLLGSGEVIAGSKRYLEFVFELFLFYFILATTLKGEQDAFRILRAAVVGLTIVALMAIFERYSGMNWVDRLITAEADAQMIRDVRATYRHRILLGTAMAMGWPLTVGLMRVAPGFSRRWVYWMAVAAMMAACYYAMSRGPWLAAVLAGALVAALGSWGLRKPLMLLGLAAVLVLLSRPGVFETLARYATSTLDADSFKGGTFQYRLELWAVAWESIQESPWHILFGFGPGAGATQSIDWVLSYRGSSYEISSWDNDFAYALFQYGVLGLAATLFVYGSVAWRLFSAARASSGARRDLYVSLCASTFVLFFMMSNVHIFARQLHYLFWALTAVGFTFIAVPRKQETTEITTNEDAPQFGHPSSSCGSTPGASQPVATPVPLF